MFNSQSLTCAAIRKHLAQFNIFVELGTALEALEQDEESVTVQLKKGETTESAKFKYVFGVDGGRGKPKARRYDRNSLIYFVFIGDFQGVTRKLLGIPFLGEKMDETIVVADARIDNVNRDVSIQLASMYLHLSFH